MSFIDIQCTHTSTAPAEPTLDGRSTDSDADADADTAARRLRVRALRQAALDAQAALASTTSELRRTHVARQNRLKSVAHLHADAATLDAQAAEWAQRAADAVDVAGRAAELRKKERGILNDARRLEVLEHALEAEHGAAEARWRAAHSAQRTETDMHTYLNAGVPAAKLLGDVLGYIMTLARERDAPQKSGALFSLAVSQVCRAWRHVALDTAALWAWIHVGNSGLHSLEAVNAFLDRSQAYPLDVLVGVAEDDILRALLAHAYRICSFRITYQGGKRTRRLLRMFNVPAPRLEQLDIRCASATPWRSRPITVFPDSPLLDTLILRGVSLDSLDLPTMQIRDFTYFPTYYDDAEEILSKCTKFPSLERIHLRFEKYNEAAHIYIDRHSIPGGLALSAISEPGQLLRILDVLAPIPANMQPTITSLTLSGFALCDAYSRMDISQLACLDTLTLTEGRPVSYAFVEPVDPEECVATLAQLRGLTRLVATDTIVHPLLAAFTHAHDPAYAPRRVAPLLAVPRIHTFAIPPCRAAHADAGVAGEACQYGEHVCAAVAARQADGVPISVLAVDASYLQAPVAHRVEWLRERVHLEVV